MIIVHILHVTSYK